MFEVDVTIIGGGIVGCAIAAQAAGQGLNTVLLEKESGLGRGTTSRNSEVSHGGMYYPTGSNKARYCVRGRRLLKEFCQKTGVGYNECGKLIVAVGEKEIPELERLLTLGQANGVEDLRLVDGQELGRMEPEIKALAGLYSPRTGVLDAEGAAKAFAHQASDQGAQILNSALVSGLVKKADLWQVEVEGTGPARSEGWTHQSRWVVNAAGLRSDTMAALAGVDVEGRKWRQTLLKGNYFKVAPVHKGRIKHLVYPVPPADGSSLGVHVCLDLAGEMKLGPDTEVTPSRELDPKQTGDGLDYQVDPGRLDSFFNSAVQFLPWLCKDDLSPDMSGYRPKLTVQGFRDFELTKETGDLAGLINLVGIDSPGLTSAAALAEDVGRMLSGEI